MIWYKSSIQERPSLLGAKMARGSPVCQQMCEQIIEMFKNNVSQRKMGRDLDISPSTVNNVIKRFKESGGISVRKGQGRKPYFNRDQKRCRLLWARGIWDGPSYSGNVYCGQTNQYFRSFLEEMDAMCPGPKKKRT